MSQGRYNAPLSPSGYRASGILLHVTSLPSPYGIGDLGPAALSWIDRLAEAGQSWWQSLPLGPPVTAIALSILSSFAGNGLLISPDWLIEDGFLETERLRAPVFPASDVDYDAVIPFKHRLLEKAWSNFKAGARADLRPAYEQFCNEQAHWLEDYALFRALKTKFTARHYLEWPAELVQRKPAALDRVRRELGGSDRPSVLCAIPVVPPGRAAEGVRAQQGLEVDRRPALFRFSRLERRVGQSGAVSPGRAAPAALRRRRASRLFQRAGTALGQSRLQLGRSSPVRLSLVRSPACDRFWPTWT